MNDSYFLHAKNIRFPAAFCQSFANAEVSVDSKVSVSDKGVKDDGGTKGGSKGNEYKGGNSETKKPGGTDEDTATTTESTTTETAATTTDTATDATTTSVSEDTKASSLTWDKLSKCKKSCFNESIKTVIYPSSRSWANCADADSTTITTQE